MRRSRNKARGNRAEQRTRKFLEKFGKIFNTASGWSNPDFEWYPDDIEVLGIIPGFGPIGFGVEVKSALSITAGEVGRIGVSRTQWVEILRYCEHFNIEPLLVLEIIIRGSFRMYWCLFDYQVNKRFEATTAKMACWSIWQFLRDGRRID